MRLTRDQPELLALESHHRLEHALHGKFCHQNYLLVEEHWKLKDVHNSRNFQPIGLVTCSFKCVRMPMTWNSL